MSSSFIAELSYTKWKGTKVLLMFDCCNISLNLSGTAYFRKINRRVAKIGGRGGGLRLCRDSLLVLLKSSLP